MKPDYQTISEIVESLEVIANIQPSNQKELLLKHANKLNEISNQLEKQIRQPKFEDGIIYALARMIDIYDEVTMAYAILHESGVDLTKIKSDDAKIVRKAGKQKVRS